MDSQQNNQNNPKKSAIWLPTLILFFRYSAWIVAPIIAALYFGKKLEAKYDHEPWIFLGSIGVAFFVSMIGLVSETYREYKRLEKNKDNKKTDDK